MCIFRDNIGHLWSVSRENLHWHLTWLRRIGRL